MVNIGQSIKEAREQLGLTRAELCRRAGIRQNTLLYIEDGTIEDPAFSKVAKLAGPLGIDLNALASAHAAHPAAQ